MFPSENTQVIMALADVEISVILDWTKKVSVDVEEPIIFRCAPCGGSFTADLEFSNPLSVCRFKGFITNEREKRLHRMSMGGEHHNGHYEGEKNSYTGRNSILVP